MRTLIPLLAALTIGAGSLRSQDWYDEFERENAERRIQDLEDAAEEAAQRQSDLEDAAEEAAQRQRDLETRLDELE